MKDKEIEIKIKIDDRDALTKKVEALGGIFKERGNEMDVLYDDGKGFYDAHKVLRLRKADKTNVLTYKEKLPKSTSFNLLERMELQTEVGDYQIMDDIIKHLGFVPYRIKEKKYEDYLLDGLKVEFHTVAFLGDFIEIETEDINKLKIVLGKLGLNLEQGINRDYGTLFSEYCEQHNLPKDTPCTFEAEQRSLPH
jgi:adenylate cyclase class 2